MSSSDDDMFEDEDDTSLSNIRAMLQSYYGTEDSNANVRIEDVTNLDSSKFDLEKYKSKVLREDGLGDLIQKNVKIVNEVKGLDTDMQKLVYENYSKFMSATKTIKTLQNNVGDMETQMNSLFDSMEKVDKYSSTIGSQLNTNRAKVEKLVSVQRLLKKLEFLFDLPSRLQSCINIEAYEQAIRYYEGSKTVLEEYPNVISFNTIMKEATVIINQLKDDLVHKLHSQDISESKLEQYIRLLLQLHYPKDELYLRYLEWHHYYLNKTIIRYLPVEEETEEDKEIKEISGESDVETDARRDYQKQMASSNLVGYVKDLTTSFIERFTAMVVTFKDIFKEDEEAHTSLLATSGKLFDIFFEAIQNKLYALEDYKSILAEPTDNEENVLFKDIYDGLDQLTASIQKVQSLLSDLTLKQTYDTIVQKFIKIQIAGSFEVLRDTTLNSIYELNTTVNALSLFKPQPPTIVQRTGDMNQTAEVSTEPALGASAPVLAPAAPEAVPPPSNVDVDNLFSMDFSDVTSSPVPPPSSLPPAPSAVPTTPSLLNTSFSSSSTLLTSTIFTAPSLTESTVVPPADPAASAEPKEETQPAEGEVQPTDDSERIDSEVPPISSPPEVPPEPEKAVAALGEEFAARFELDMIHVIERLQPILDTITKILPENVAQYTTYYHTQCQQLFVWLFTIVNGYNNKASILTLGDSDLLVLGTSDISKKKSKKCIYLSPPLLPSVPVLTTKDLSYRTCLALHVFAKYLTKKGIKNIMNVILDHTPTEVEITSNQLNHQIGYSCIVNYSQDSSSNMIKQYSVILGEQLAQQFIASILEAHQQKELAANTEEQAEGVKPIDMDNYISPASLLILQILYTSYNDLLQIFTDINPNMNNPEFTSVTKLNRRRESSTTGMYNYLEKALSAKIRIYPYELKYTMKDIINCTIKCMMKYLLETFRGLYFDKEDYLYTINNIVFITGMLKRISQDDEDYKSIIMEVMNVLSERCQDILSVTVDYNHQIDLCNSYADKV